MIRSRLRRPTSKSITATFLPAMARPVASEALVVVLPTPPLPEVTTIISAVKSPSPQGCCCSRSQFCDQQFFALEPALHGPALEVVGNLFEHAVLAGDGHQCRPEIGDVDARLLVALRTGHGASTQAAVDVDIAIGDHFGAVGDRTGDDQVAVAGVDLLAGTYRTVVVLRAQRMARF